MTFRTLVALVTIALPVHAQRILVSLPANATNLPRDGRLLLLLSTDSTAEPREQINYHDNTQQMFGIDVHDLSPSHPGVFDAHVLGYPKESLADVPPGDYWIQAVLHPYEVYHRGDGHTVELPPDRGEGQHWENAPGSPMSRPTHINFDPRKSNLIRITLDAVIPPLPDMPDTKYVKHIRIQSERLTKFWGRPTYLGAIVLLPEGFETHPNAHYPLAIEEGHFPRAISGWREEPADATLPEPNLAEIAHDCPNGSALEHCNRPALRRLSQEQAYAFYKKWTGPGFPRVIIVEIQHANPYYDDSYAVNSANVGPYGDAITYELIPYIEQHYRGLGPWARAVYGGSTGGWEALGVQVFYPDQYNGSWAFCPDPVDFDAYTNIDIYRDQNAYYTAGYWRRTPRNGERTHLGDILSTVEQQNINELVTGTHSRSGGQWDIWEAVFSPVGADGYPARIWDKRTGVIDTAVAAYWREHYDLVHIMQRDWAKIGPELRGKIHLYAGESDSWFLNNAVYLADDFLKATHDPPADAVVEYGDRDEHCWTGDHDHPNTLARGTVNERFIPQMVKRWLETAPAGADTTSWRY
jgi:Putative esterase